MVPFVGPGGKVFPLTTVTSLPFPPRANLLILSGLSGFVSRLEWHSGISRASCFELRWHHDHRASTELVFPNKQSHQVMLVEEGICLSWSSAPSLFRSRVPGICFRLPCLLLFITLNREDFSFVIHLDRQPRTSRRREAQTGSRARSGSRSGSRSERTLDAVEHSRTLMEWWPFLIFHRGGLRIKVINNICHLCRYGSTS